MPSKTAPPEPAAPADAPEPEAGGVFEYVGAVPTVYLHVPLTARPATEDGPATVFAWPDGAPADGRWATSRKKPNQGPDNAAVSVEG